MDISTDKAALRRRLYALRREAHRDRQGAPQAARDHALAAGLFSGAGIVAGYRPIRTELDPTPLMTALSRQGTRLCVPVIEGEGRPLAFREWTLETAMVPGAFGAEIPAEGAWLTPDALIVPLVGFDAGGWRLGYGGGFYDRTLARLRAGRGAVAVGLAYAAQRMEAVPREPTDARLDAVVTEAGVIRL